MIHHRMIYMCPRDNTEKTRHQKGQPTPNKGAGFSGALSGALRALRDALWSFFFGGCGTHPGTPPPAPRLRRNMLISGPPGKHTAKWESHPIANRPTSSDSRATPTTWKMPKSKGQPKQNISSRPEQHPRNAEKAHEAAASSAYLRN